MTGSPRPAPWLVLAAMWLTLGVAFGLFFSFTIFFVPLIEEFRWSRGATAGAFSLSTLVQGVLSPAVGMLVDRIGPRRVILAGALLLGAAFVLAGLIQTLWQLYLITGVLAAVGVAAVGWVPSGALLAGWFSRRRGGVMGLAFSGIGAGVLVVGPLAQWLISAVGWRHAYMLLGVGTLVCLGPVLVFGVAEAPASSRAAGARAETLTPTEGVGIQAALTTRTFWGLFFAYFFTPLAVFPVFTHQVAFAVDEGFPRMFVAEIFGLMGFMSSIGRVAFGVVSDRLGRELAATLSFVCTAAGAGALLLLEVWPHAGWLYAYALLFGLGFGARGPIITALASELFAGRRFGAIYGVLNVGNGVGAAIGPWFGGTVHDVTGSYRIAFLTSIGFCAVGAACFWIARRRPQPSTATL